MLTRVLAMALLAMLANAAANAQSIEFFQNGADQFDHLRQTTLPAGFGAGEFTLELWIRPNNSFPVGSTSGNGVYTNWSSADGRPYDGYGWWFNGNFLLDGHNNAAFERGTFSLQFHGGGRVRWMFSDGSAPSGGVYAVQAYPANATPSLLDGSWHQITLVRRWSGSSASTLEMWIDGVLIDDETVPRRTNMRQFWDTWSGYPSAERGWFWGAEKQSAVYTGYPFEDYKGLLDEVRFWTRAKTAAEIQAGYASPVSGSESGLAGRYAFEERAGTSTCNALAASQCMTLVRSRTGTWATPNAPLAGAPPPPPPPPPQQQYRLRQLTTGFQVRPVHARNADGSRGAQLTIGNVPVNVFVGNASALPACNENDTAFDAASGQTYMRITAPATCPYGHPLGQNVTGYANPCDLVQP